MILQQILQDTIISTANTVHEVKKEEHLISDNLLGIIVINVFGIISYFAKSWWDRKKTKQEMSSRDKRLMLKVEEISTEIVQVRLDQKELREMFEKHTVDNDFPAKFKDVLQKAAARKISKYGRLDDDHDKALNLWTDLVEKFALMFYDSSLRKGDKDELDEFLNSKMNIAIGDLNRFLEKNITIPKEYKASKIYFHDFLGSDNKEFKVLPIHNLTQVLIMKLVENGLTQETVIKLFVKYINDFIDRYFMKLDIWNGKDLKERYHD